MGADRALGRVTESRMKAARRTTHVWKKKRVKDPKKHRLRELVHNFLRRGPHPLAADRCRKKEYPPKWVTATIGTVAPFTFVIYVYRRRLLRWSFWVALSICLLIHTVTVAVIFRYVLNDFQSFSIWLWFPIMLSEVFALLIAVKKMGETLTGKRDTTRLTF